MNPSLWSPAGTYSFCLPSLTPIISPQHALNTEYWSRQTSLSLIVTVNAEIVLHLVANSTPHRCCL
jgi:hypothetical protein